MAPPLSDTVISAEVMLSAPRPWRKPLQLTVKVVVDVVAGSDFYRAGGEPVTEVVAWAAVGVELDITDVIGGHRIDRVGVPGDAVERGRGCAGGGQERQERPAVVRDEDVVKGDAGAAGIVVARPVDGECRRADLAGKRRDRACRVAGIQGVLRRRCRDGRVGVEDDRFPRGDLVCRWAGRLSAAR